MFQNILKPCHTDLTLIIHVRCHFELGNQLVPLGPDFLENSAKRPYGLISMQLVMQLAVVLSFLRRLEAFIMLTNYDLGLLRNILPEVQTFGWKHF